MTVTRRGKSLKKTLSDVEIAEAFIKFVPTVSNGPVPDANLLEGGGVRSVVRNGAGVYEVTLTTSPFAVVRAATTAVKNDVIANGVSSQTLQLTPSGSIVRFVVGGAASDVFDSATVTFDLRLSK